MHAKLKFFSLKNQNKHSISSLYNYIEYYLTLILEKIGLKHEFIPIKNTNILGGHIFEKKCLTLEEMSHNLLINYEKIIARPYAY